MRRSVLLLLMLVFLASCKSEISNSKGLKSDESIVGSWVRSGASYAGSKIMGTLTFVFNSDKTFVALDKAKGMPTITETGSWLVNGDTLKMKFRKNRQTRPNIIAYEERNGGPNDLLKPDPADTSGVIAWNFKINGNRLFLENPNYISGGSCELTKD